MRSDYLNDNSSLSNQFLEVKKITEDYTCLASDSGSYILVNPTAATTVTLPTISEDLVGWYVKVIIGEDVAAAETLFKVLAKYGGKDLVGNSTTLTPGTFWSGFRY